MGDFISGLFKGFSNQYLQHKERQYQEEQEREAQQLKTFHDLSQYYSQMGDTEGLANVFKMKGDYIAASGKGGKGKKEQQNIWHMLSEGLANNVLPVGAQTKDQLSEINPMNAPQGLTQQAIPQMQVTDQVMPVAQGQMGFNPQGNPELRGRSLQTQVGQQADDSRKLMVPLQAGSPPLQDYTNRKRFFTPKDELDEKEFGKQKRLMETKGDIDTNRALQVQDKMLARQLAVQGERGKIQLQIAQGVENRDMNKLTKAIMADNPTLSLEEAQAQAGGMITDKFRVAAEVGSARIQRMRDMTVHAQKQLAEKQREFELTLNQRERQGNARIGIAQQNANTLAAGLGVKQQISDASRVIGQMGQIVTESNRHFTTLSNPFAPVEAKAEAEQRLKALDRDYEGLSKQLEGLKFDTAVGQQVQQPQATQAPQFKVNDRVKLKSGKEVTITKIYPDGRFDYEEK